MPSTAVGGRCTACLHCVGHPAQQRRRMSHTRAHGLVYTHAHTGTTCKRVACSPGVISSRDTTILPPSLSLSLSLSAYLSLSLSDSCSPEMSNRTRRGCCCPDVCALQQHSPPPRGPAAPAVPSWTKSGPNWVRTAPGRAASWTDDSAPGPAGPSKPLGRSRGVGRACRRWGRRGSARLRGRCWRPQPAAFEAASLVAAVASPVAEVAFSTASWEAPVVRLGCVLLGVCGS